MSDSYCKYCEALWIKDSNGQHIHPSGTKGKYPCRAIAPSAIQPVVLPAIGDMSDMTTRPVHAESQLQSRLEQARREGADELILAHRCGCEVCSTGATLCPATRSSIAQTHTNLEHLRASLREAEKRELGALAELDECRASLEQVKRMERAAAIEEMVAMLRSFTLTRP